VVVDWLSNFQENGLEKQSVGSRLSLRPIGEIKYTEAEEKKTKAYNTEARKICNERH
jgi:hypothetical protein